MYVWEAFWIGVVVAAALIGILFIWLEGRGVDATRDMHILDQHRNEERRNSACNIQDHER